MAFHVWVALVPSLLLASQTLPSPDMDACFLSIRKLHISQVFILVFLFDSYTKLQYLNSSIIPNFWTF